MSAVVVIHQLEPAERKRDALIGLLREFAESIGRRLDRETAASARKTTPYVEIPTPLVGTQLSVPAVAAGGRARSTDNGDQAAGFRRVGSVD